MAQFPQFLTDVRSENCSFGHVKRYLNLTSLADCEPTLDRKHNHNTSIPDRRHCILAPVSLYRAQSIHRNEILEQPGLFVVKLIVGDKKTSFTSNSQCFRHMRTKPATSSIAPHSLPLYLNPFHATEHHLQ